MDCLTLSYMSYVYVLATLWGGQEVTGLRRCGRPLCPAPTLTVSQLQPSPHSWRLLLASACWTFLYINTQNVIYTYTFTNIPTFFWLIWNSYNDWSDLPSMDCSRFYTRTLHTVVTKLRTDFRWKTHSSQSRLSRGVSCYAKVGDEGYWNRLHIFIYNFMKNVLCCHLLELSAHCCDSCVHLPERLMCELSQLMTRSLHRLVQMSRATRLTLASAESRPSRIEQTVSTFDTQCSSIAASTFACVTSQTPVTISCTCTNWLISD